MFVVMIIMKTNMIKHVLFGVTKQNWALRCSITSDARNYCHLRRKISVAWALRYSITSGVRNFRSAIYGGEYEYQ